MRACLGQSAISSRKLEHGRELVILGIQICVDSEGVNFWPAPDKVSKWSDMICKAMLEGVCRYMTALLRSLTQLHYTLHGRRSRVQWASQSAFKGFGRAMLRPLIDHQKAKSPALSVELRLALLWWVELLQLELRQYHTQLSSNALPSVCHLLGAARIGGSDVVANSYTCSQTQGVRQQEWRQYFTGVPVRLALARHCGSASFCEGWRLVLL